jgi:hypothetical protein
LALPSCLLTNITTILPVSFSLPQLAYPPYLPTPASSSMLVPLFLPIPPASSSLSPHTCLFFPACPFLFLPHLPLPPCLPPPVSSSLPVPFFSYPTSLFLLVSPHLSLLTCLYHSLLTLPASSSLSPHTCLFFPACPFLSLTQPDFSSTPFSMGGRVRYVMSRLERKFIPCVRPPSSFYCPNVLSWVICFKMWYCCCF